MYDCAFGDFGGFKLKIRAFKFQKSSPEKNVFQLLEVFFRNFFYHTPFFIKFSYIDVGQKYNYDVLKWLYSYSNIEGQEILTLSFTTRIVVKRYVFLSKIKRKQKIPAESKT